MIRWILGKMEHTPNAVFYGRELEERFPEGFRHALQDGLIIKVAPNFESYSYGLDTTYRVVQDENGFEAFNEDDPEEEPIRLSAVDLIRYKLNLEAFAKIVQNENVLLGKPEQLNERLFFLGESENDGRLIAYILVFVNNSPALRSVVTEIPLLLSKRYRTFVAVYPSSIPDSTERRRLEGMNILTTLLPVDSVSLPSIQSLMPRPSIPDLLVTATSIKLREQAISVTPLQSAFFDILYKALITGETFLTSNQIKNRLASYSREPQKISDVTKRLPVELKALIKRSGKNRYTLDLNS